MVAIGVDVLLRGDVLSVPPGRFVRAPGFGEVLYGLGVLLPAIGGLRLARVVRPVRVGAKGTGARAPRGLRRLFHLLRGVVGSRLETTRELFGKLGGHGMLGHHVEHFREGLAGSVEVARLRRASRLAGVRFDAIEEGPRPGDDVLGGGVAGIELERLLRRGDGAFGILVLEALARCVELRLDGHAEDGLSLPIVGCGDRGLGSLEQHHERHHRDRHDRADTEEERSPGRRRGLRHGHRRRARGGDRRLASRPWPAGSSENSSAAATEPGPAARSTGAASGVVGAGWVEGSIHMAVAATSPGLCRMVGASPMAPMAVASSREPSRTRRHSSRASRI